HAIYRNAGLKSEGKGIAFSIPVDDVIGVSASFAKVDPDEKEEVEKQPEKQPEKQEEKNTDNE
ncbi:MAG: hypothetical protein K2J13_03155, partial [Clostridia bacterium]|nr:hypothetical protein [Clostridia bacterium]